MKLRNKKTGEVVDVESLGHAESLKEKYGYQVTLSWATKYENLSQCRTYETLAELNEEWEDYAPAEPLIKDEKIRKAVRAWAEALGLQEVYCASNGYEIYGGTDDWVIQFEGEPFPFADKNKIYTIAELCGEEGE